MSSGSVISAMTRSFPPHNGRSEMSISNVRFNRWAQVRGAVSGAVGGSVSESEGAMGACVGLSAWFAGVVAEPLDVDRFRAPICVGTIMRRRGANTPW